MLEKYTKDIELLRKWYKYAKEVAIIAESMDSLNKGYIQPLHELRYCLDHFVRAFENEAENRSEEMVRKSIASAIGHLQRTYSDSVEWMLVNVKEEYMYILDQYTNEQIQVVFPEYYAEIRPDIEKITKIVNQYKIDKSVELATDTETGLTILDAQELKMLGNVSEQFVNANVVNKLQEYLEQLHTKETSLMEMRKRGRKTAFCDKFLLPTIVGIIGVIVGIILPMIF